MIVVSNASPLISLSRIGQLELLPSLFQTVSVAEEVFQEVTVAGAGKPAASAVARANWLVRKTVPAQPWFAGRERKFGRGELHTIALAEQVRADLAVIDERGARRLAEGRGLNVMGCVGLLEVGFRRGLVGDLREVYQRLEHEGAFVSRAILDRSLSDFGLPPLS